MFSAHVCQCAFDTTVVGCDADVTALLFCRCVDVAELPSDVDILDSAASASGKFGGVTGVLAGVRI